MARPVLGRGEFERDSWSRRCCSDIEQLWATRSPRAGIRLMAHRFGKPCIARTKKI